MSYWYYDDKDGYKKKQYDGDPVFVIHEEAEGKSTKMISASGFSRAASTQLWSGARKTSSAPSASAVAVR